MGNLALLAPPTNRIVLVSGLVAAAGTATALLLQDQPWTLRGDNANQTLPLMFAAYDQWMHGAVPGWGTRMWSGHFLVAEPIAGSFYPPHWISFWLTPSPHLRALDIDAALHMGILVSGTVALLARLGVPRLGALVAAALVASMPPTLGWMFFEFRFAAIVWLPWALLGAECLCDPGARMGRQVLLGSMAVAAPFLAGSPETFLQSALIVGVWLLTRASGLPLAARLLRGTALALATLLLISPQLIPTALSVPASTRSGVPVLQALGGVPIDGLGALIAPASAGAVSAVGSPYLGAACLGLALIALFARARCAFILAGVALASLLVSMGTATPLYGWLTQVPPFKLFQGPWKYYPPAAHAITFMAGMGIGVLCRWGRRGVWPALALAALALVERAVVMPAILSGPFIMPPNPPDVTALESVLPELV